MFFRGKKSPGLILLALLLSGCSAEEASPPRQPGAEKAASTVSAVSAASPHRPKGERSFEILGDTGVIQVRVSGFDKLTLDQKKQVYYSCLAADPGDDIHTQQQGARNLAIQKLLAGIRSAGRSVPGHLRAKIVPFAKRFAINHGNRDAWTGEKIRPPFIPGELAAAAQIALSKGIDIGLDGIAGADLGANQLEQIEGLLRLLGPDLFDRRYEPVGADAGLGAVQDDFIAGRLSDIASHLENAQKYAGDEVVETAVGFVETGVFRGIAMVRDQGLSARIDALTKRVPDYEKLLTPLGVIRIEPVAWLPYQVVLMTGDRQPEATARLTLRAGAGSAPKSFYLSNLPAARDRVYAPYLIRAFSPSSDVAGRRNRWKQAVRDDFFVLRDVIGAGTVGRGSLGRGDDQETLAAIQRDLVALYLVFAEQNRDAGPTPGIEREKAVYDNYVSGLLERLAFSRSEKDFTGPDMRARLTIVKLLVKEGAVKEVERDHHVYLEIPDYFKMRASVGELLSNLNKGVAMPGWPEKWRADAARRLDAIGLPAKTAFVYPAIDAQVNEKNEIVDIKLGRSRWRFDDMRDLSR